MKTLKKLFIFIAAAFVALIAVGMFLPRTAHVERSISIKAPPAMVFTVLNGFRQFERWSPWADIDPNDVTTYEGPESGVGAKMAWAGNAEVGSGSQEILESTPYSQIKVRLGFGDFPGDFRATYTLSPEDDGTKVTWGFDADYGNNVAGRYFGLLSDSMLGPDYEKGLGRLKQFVEGMPKADFSGLQFETTASTAQPLMLLSVRSPNDANAIGVALGVAYGKLSGFISAQGLKQAGPPMAIFYGESGGMLSMDAAIPVDRTDVPPPQPMRAGRTFEGRVVKVVHQGDYAGLIAAREKVRAYLATAGLTQDGPMWEQYVSDPGTTTPADLITNIFVPIK
jgi:effector-binding domain-containing protein